MRATVQSPQHRARILAELYLRAYWRYYMVASIWVAVSWVLLSPLPH